MFDKALNSLIGITIVCASAALAVFAAGFALYALALPQLGAPGAAAAVAALAALVVAMAGVLQLQRNKTKEREAALAQSELSSVLPEPLRGLMQRHPLAAIAATVVGGLIAARNPRIVRELVAALRSDRR
jgi:hypothetical protein